MFFYVIITKTDAPAAEAANKRASGLYPTVEDAEASAAARNAKAKRLGVSANYRAQAQDAPPPGLGGDKAPKPWDQKAWDEQQPAA